jgi:hypothetical protein
LWERASARDLACRSRPEGRSHSKHTGYSTGTSVNANTGICRSMSIGSDPATHKVIGFSG